MSHKARHTRCLHPETSVSLRYVLARTSPPHRDRRTVPSALAEGGTAQARRCQPPRNRRIGHLSRHSGDPGRPAQWCIHFRSMSDHDTCEAGLRYSAFGTYKTRPCFLDETGASKPNAFPCEKLRRPRRLSRMNDGYSGAFGRRRMTEKGKGHLHRTALIALH